MRIPLRISLVALTLATSLGALTPIGRTVCAGASLVARPKTVPAGGEVVVVGENWASQCNDVISCAVGCLGESCEGGEPSPPIVNLVLSLDRHGQAGTTTILLDNVDAGREDLGFRVVATIPPDLEPGRYLLVAENARGASAETTRPIRVVAPGDIGPAE